MRGLLQLARYLRDLARELSDETAYHRYLERGSLQHSAEEWRRFCDMRLRKKYQQGKCC
jgi:hypothetical protein